jgi:hypothetical protein
MHHVIDWYDGRGLLWRDGSVRVWYDGCGLLCHDGCIRVCCDLRDSVGVRVSVRVSRAARFAAGQAGGISRIEKLIHLEN